jgi:HSP20 family protein
MSAQRRATRRQGDVGTVHYHVTSSGRQFLVLRHSHTWHPPTDVIEGEDRLYVVIEIAGMQEGDFHVTLDGRQLTISGTRQSEGQAGSAYHQLEIRFGEFRTDVALPWAVEENEIEATYSDGFLRIELPRAHSHSVHVVDVAKAGEPPDQT